MTKLQIVNLSPDQHKVSVQSLAESCGFIPNRFGKNFGYEASTAAILRLVAKVKEHSAEIAEDTVTALCGLPDTERLIALGDDIAENIRKCPELYPKNSAIINLYQT
jgi:hypothetical protein